MTWQAKWILEAENKGAGDYKITLPADGDTYDIDCNLSNVKNMNCNLSFMDINVDFEK